MTFVVDGTNGLTFNDSTTQSSTATNASNISSGTLGKARLPTGSVLQVVQATTTTTISGNNVDVNTYNFQCAITPTYSTSKILAIVSVNGIDTSGTGRVSTFLYVGTTGGDTSGSQVILVQVANPGSGTTGLSTNSFSYLSNAVGSTTTQYYKIINTKNDNSSNWYIQRFNVASTITLMEIAA